MLTLMRVREPQEFDPEREYKPKERAIYKGIVIFEEICTKADQRLADDPGTLFGQRCVRCKIDRDVCTGAHLKCDKCNRTDRKTIFWRLAYPKTVRTNKKLER